MGSTGSGNMIYDISVLNDGFSCLPGVVAGFLVVFEGVDEISKKRYSG
ncbi:MAG: hypothetical protein IPP38_17050 [Bacteroidetes bacterium]|nr:hypothetical protein [Bacteroidota bacterium]